MKKISIVGCLAAACLALGVSAARCASVEFDSLNLAQGFNYQKDVQKPVGYITSLKIGGTAVPADLALKDAAGAVTAVGVLESVTWAGGHGDALEFKAAVSLKNKQALQLMLHKSLTSTAVQMQFTVYNYDAQKKQYYTAFQPGANAVLNGQVQKEDKDLKLTVNDQPTAVKSPANYEMTLNVMPASQSQTLTFATGAGASVAKQWGITVTQ